MSDTYPPPPEDPKDENSDPTPPRPWGAPPEPTPPPADSEAWPSQPSSTGTPWGAPPPQPDASSGWTPPPPPPPPAGHTPTYGSGQNAYGDSTWLQPGSVPPNATAQDHPRTVLIFVLGLVGMLCCQLLGPVVWYLGHQAREETKANPAYKQDNLLLTLGWAFGIVGTVLIGLSIFFNSLSLLF